MTSKSRLSHRFELCEMVKQLDNDGCISVRPIYHELGYSSLNTLLLNMILHLTDNVPNDSLIKMKNIMNDIITAKSIHNNNYNNENDKQIIQAQHVSKLLRLPIDLISNLSLFLKEKDIFNFGKCCKIFYHIVNNSSFINQSKTFKTFRLTSQRLGEMTQAKRSFYKWSKATRLTITSSCENQGAIQFDKAMIVGSYDKWLETMFKSIKTLKIRTNGIILLPQLPIDLLFDQIESNLETIVIDAPQLEDYININKFCQKYIVFKKQFENQGKKIKVLKCLEQSIVNATTNSVSQLLDIETKHSCIHAGMGGSPLKHLLERNFKFCNSSLEILTLKLCRFGSIDINTINCNCNGPPQSQINTLRLIDLDSNSNTDILENWKLIELLNFHNSVKNLTVNCTLYHKRECDIWRKIICNLLTKKYYFNLVNLNILLQFFDWGLRSEKDLVNCIFEILKQHQQILKHQFNQLNIGFDIVDSLLGARFYVLEWNCKVDEKFSNHFQQQCNKGWKQTSTKGEPNLYKEKYHSAMQQWI